MSLAKGRPSSLRLRDIKCQYKSLKKTLFISSVKEVLVPSMNMFEFLLIFLENSENSEIFFEILETQFFLVSLIFFSTLTAYEDKYKIRTNEGTVGN